MSRHRTLQPWASILSDPFHALYNVNELGTIMCSSMILSSCAG